LIVDALRHRTKSEPRRGDVKTGGIPDTLGYPRRPSRRGLSPQRIIGIAAGAIALGFLAVALPVYWTARQTVRPTTVAAEAPQFANRGPIQWEPPAAVAPALPLTVPAPLLPASVPSTEPTNSETPLPTAPPSVPAVAAMTVATSAPPRTLRKPRESRQAAPSEPAPMSIPASGRPVGPDHFAMALHYQRVSDYTQALAQYRILLEQNDASAEVHNNLGLLHQDHGNNDEAIRELRRAIALDPSYVKAHNNLGVAYLRSRQLDDAAAEFTVALGIDERNIESLVNLGLVQKRAGRTAEARELLRRAVSIDPRHAGSHYNLALLADEGGDLVTAVTHYRAFLRYGTVRYPDLAARVRSRLATLETG
jgi:tetratricopeptide (TPR) repeat protein